MNYLLVIKADTNDGDYVEKTTAIIPGSKYPPEHYVWFTDIAEAIAELHGQWPYDAWNTKGSNMEDIYALYEQFEPDRLDAFHQMVPTDDQGNVHTIKQLRVHTVIGTHEII